MVLFFLCLTLSILRKNTPASISSELNSVLNIKKYRSRPSNLHVVREDFFREKLYFFVKIRHIRYEQTKRR